MSIEQNCNDNTVNQEDGQLVSPAVPFWMRVTVKPENSALAPEADEVGASETALESDDTFAILMEAIEGTEIARRLGSLRPRGNRPPPPPTSTEAPAVAAVTANSDAPTVVPVQPAAKPPEPVAGTIPQPSAIEESQENEDIYTNLLRAIEGTNIARQLGVIAPEENDYLLEPGLTEAAEALTESVSAEALSETPPPVTKPEEEPVYSTAHLHSAPEDAQENGEISATTLEETAAAEIAATLDVSTTAVNVQETESIQPIDVDTPGLALERTAAETTCAELGANATAPPLELSDSRESGETSITRPEDGAVSESGAAMELAAATNGENSRELAPIEAKEAEGARAVIEPSTAAQRVTATETEPNADATSLLSELGEAREKDEAGVAALSTAENTEIAAAAEIVTPEESKQETEPAQTVEMDAASSAVEALNASAPSGISTETEQPAAIAQRAPTRRTGTRVRREAAPLPRRRKISDRNARRKRATETTSGATAEIPFSTAELMQEAAELQVFEAPTLPEGPAEPAFQPAHHEPQPPADVEPVRAIEVTANPTQAPMADACEPSAAADVCETAASVIPQSAPASDHSSASPVPTRTGGGVTRVAFRQTGDYLDRAEMHLQSLFLRWFDPPDPRRHSTRLAAPPLAAYHWAMDVPQGLKVANISSGGMYLLTDERWTDGVIVSLTLQRTDMPKGSAESWIAVDFVVTRWCEDGIAGAFIPSRPGQYDAVAGRAMNCADKKTLERFVTQLATPAQALG